MVRFGVLIFASRKNIVFVDSMFVGVRFTLKLVGTNLAFYIIYSFHFF